MVIDKKNNFLDFLCLGIVLGKNEPEFSAALHHGWMQGKTPVGWTRCGSPTSARTREIRTEHLSFSIKT